MRPVARWATGLGATPGGQACAMHSFTTCPSGAAAAAHMRDSQVRRFGVMPSRTNAMPASKARRGEGLVSPGAGLLLFGQPCRPRMTRRATSGVTRISPVARRAR